MAKIKKIIGKKGVTWQIDYIDPHRKRVRQMFKKRKDAAAELGKRVSLMAEGRYLDVKKDYKTALGELVGKYQENYENQASYRTFKKYAVENIKEYFGADNKLSTIRYLHVETYRNHLLQKLTKKGTIRKAASTNREMACLRHMMSKAVEWDMMEASPFSRGKNLQLKENNKRLRFLSQDEILRLQNECPRYLRNIVECAINTGMRKGEILNLKWPQIKNGLIYLQEKIKNNEARQIPINDTLKKVFARIKKYGEEPNVERIDRKKVNPKPSKAGHVFTYNGQPVKDVKRAFTNALGRAGIEDFHFHDLRHTFASHLVMNGATIKDVQELLGHKDTKMTNRYAHLSPEHKQKAVNLLNKLTAPEADMTEKSQIFENEKVSLP